MHAEAALLPSLFILSVSIPQSLARFHRMCRERVPLNSYVLGAIPATHGAVPVVAPLTFSPAAPTHLSTTTATATTYV